MGFRHGRQVAVVALVFLSLLPLARPAAAGTGVWTPLGPDGGSVWAVAVDPDDADVVYAGTRNGVFKSLDAGATWTSASKGLGPVGVWVRSLAVTSGAVYAGTDANGVYRSTDGGATWASASAGLPGPAFSPHVGALVADPRSPDRIWAGTSRGVFLTTNGGLSWQERRRGLPLDVPTFGLALAPDGKTLYAANVRSLYKTTNQGKSWERVRNGLTANGFFEVAVDPAHPATVFAGGPGLWKSTDGGAHWMRVAAKPLDGSVVALAFQGGRLYVSNWRALTQQIYFSDDLGATWIAATQSPSDPVVVDLAAGPDVVYAGSRSDLALGGVFRSLDRGRTWDLSISGLHSLGTRAVAVDPSNPDVLYVGVDDLGIFKSVDRGATWEPLPFDLLLYYKIKISTVLVDPSDPDTVYAGSGFGPGGLFHSRDGGRTWIPHAEDVPALVEVVASDPRTAGAVWAAGAPGLYHSDDYGKTWKRQPGLGGDHTWLRAFQVDPHDPDVLWAAGSEIESPPAGGVRLRLRLFRSADAGQTWQRRETGLGGTSVLALAVDPADSSLLLAGTDSGLFRSADAGLNWTRVPGFAAAVNTIVAAPTTPTAFYAHLEGFGVQRSTDGGLTWTPARRGLAPVPVNTLTVDPTDPRRLYAASRTRGVFADTEPIP